MEIPFFLRVTVHMTEEIVVDSVVGHAFLADWACDNTPPNPIANYGDNRLIAFGQLNEFVLVQVPF